MTFLGICCETLFLTRIMRRSDPYDMQHNLICAVEDLVRLDAEGILHGGVP